MTSSTPECDWKYMQTIREGLLATLCDRINKQCGVILAELGKSEHEKYLKVYKHVKESDDIVALCFNDWRRSTLLIRILEIRRQCLMTPLQTRGLSRDTQEKLRGFE